MYKPLITLFATALLSTVAIPAENAPSSGSNEAPIVEGTALSGSVTLNGGRDRLRLNMLNLTRPREVNLYI
jgi:hypothetical protein